MTSLFVVYVTAVIALLFLLNNGGQAAPAEDLVVDLPGLKNPKFKHYSGYLESNYGIHLHYWFLESELSPANSPLVLWMNGGPGCSSVYGLLTEHGAFRVNDDGMTLSMNPYSWNKVANVIYLEAPAGVGFSYSDSKDYATDDDEVAKNNLAALHSFFKKFPEYKKNDFYVTGESYGGIYVPTLSALVLNDSANFNFKGFAIGNGLHSRDYNTDSAILFLAFRGVFSPVTLENLFENCCQPGKPVTCNFLYAQRNKTCINALYAATSDLGDSGLNMYSIYNPCQASDQASHHYLAKQFHPLARIFENQEENATINGTTVNVTKFTNNLRLDPPCVDSSVVRKWINQDKVRAALHIPKSLPSWETCSEEVGSSYSPIYDDTFQFYKDLLPYVRALIYHGDTDAMCNYMGGEWFVESLNMPVLQKYKRWTFQNQTAGFIKHYQNISYATVLGSGHMVPTDKPGQAFKLFSNFLYDKPIN